MKKFWNWLKKHMKFGYQDDLSQTKECDPNEPCREIEPKKFFGIKIKTKF